MNALIQKRERTLRIFNRLKPDCEQTLAADFPSHGVIEQQIQLLTTGLNNHNEIIQEMLDLNDPNANEEQIEQWEHEFQSQTTQLIGRMQDIVRAPASEQSYVSAHANAPVIDKTSILYQLNLIQTFIDKLTVNEMPQAMITLKITKLQTIEEQLQAYIAKKSAMNMTPENLEAFQAERDQMTEQIESKFSVLFAHLHDTSSSRPRNDPKLQPLEVPKFDGNVLNWIPFRDKFISLVHDNKNLTDVCKFTYLKQFLTDKNSPILTDTETADAYQDAWERVKKHYGDDRALMASYLDAIHKISHMNGESADELKRVINEAKKNISAIKRINTDKDLFEIHMAHLILRHLDSHTRDLFETQNKSQIPVWTSLLEFLEERSKVLASISASSKKQPAKQTFKSTFPAVSSSSSAQVFTAQVDNQRKKTAKCSFCSDQHYSAYCPSIQSLKPEQIREKATQMNICLNCFGKHSLSNCPSKFRCRTCKDMHHTRIHTNLVMISQPAASQSTSTVSSQQASSSSPQVTTNISTVDNTQTMLSTVIIKVMDRFGKWHKVRALLDSGSSVCFITLALLYLLQLAHQKKSYTGSGFGDAQFDTSLSTVATIRNAQKTFSSEVEFLVRDKLTAQIPLSYVEEGKFEIPFGCKLSDPNFNKPGKIDMIIGNQLLKKIETGEKISLPNGIDLFNTVFGWAVAGGIQMQAVQSHQVPIYANVVTPTGNLYELKQSIEKFYKLEDYKTNKRFLTTEEMACEQHFEQTYKRLDNGQFQVDIPFRSNVNELANNYNIAYNQLLRCEKKLKSDPAIQQQYFDFMKEYRDLGHMTEIDITKDEPGLTVYYLPHHPVIKSESSTTKLRVVFNASSITASGLSLNDTQYVGPNVQSDSFIMLIKFRTHRFVAKSDIAKMYRTVLVNPDQRRLQRILWRDETVIVKAFQLNTVTYGTASGTFCATRPLKQLAIDNQKECPDAARDLEENTYVDDVFSGANTVEELKTKAQQLIKITASAGMNLRKFNSNSEEFLNSLPDDKKESTLADSNSVYKALGIRWNPKSDVIGFTGTQFVNDKVTKKHCLSQIAKIFDPNGLLAPATFRFKLFLKLCHQQNTNWDQLLPDEVQELWLKLSSTINDIEKINIPRLAVIPNAIKLQLHGFSDASNDGYGAAIYIRSEDSLGHIQVTLLCAKSRISSDELRMPRLELCSGVILSHLISQVGEKLQISEQFCWMDSMIALHWISKEPANLQPFVANRVHVIQSLASHCKWSHVAGTDNPADLVSRGLSVQQLVDNNIWWNGPSFLSQQQDEWPESRLEFDLNDPRHLCEIRAPKVAAFSVTVNDNMFLTMANNTSSFYALRRKMMPIMRFIHNCKAKISKSQLRAMPLNADDAKDAEIAIARVHQMCYMTEEYKRISKNELIQPKSKLSALSPIWDADNQIIRVGGRLTHANITDDQKHQIIIPPVHLANIIIRHFHINNVHSGIRATISFIQQYYWIMNIKQLTRSMQHKCISCYRAKPKLGSQFMAPLPSSRINPSIAFNQTGVDFAGPFKTKDSDLRRPKYFKTYISIFVCMATKAVHIEVVSSLSTPAFLNAFSRFISRRGKPETMYSDNGSNFLGANNTLTEIGEALVASEKDFHKFFTDKLIKWKFICPASPAHGGLWEAAVKSMKTHLHAAIGNTILTFENLSTVCCQIEAMLNSRPLTYIDDDPNDIRPLTPGHFLIFRPLNSRPEAPLAEKIIPDAYLYDRMVQIQNQFWKRWQTEYLNHLQTRTKNSRKQHEYKVDQIVLICEWSNSPVLHWPLGRIIEIMPGSDGLVRMARVINSEGKVLFRPVTKLAILPIDDNHNEQSPAAQDVQSTTANE